MNGMIEVIRGKAKTVIGCFDTVCDATHYAKNESAKIKYINVIFMVHVPNYIDDHVRYFFYMNGHFLGDNDIPMISDEILSYAYKRW